MKERLQLLIGQLLVAGLLISLALAIFGGALFLVKHGGEVVNYQVFHKEPLSAPASRIWQDLSTFSAYSLIQLGIFILVLTQVLRMVLVTWYYYKLDDLKFVWLSLFILGMLIFSLLWKIFGIGS